MITRLRYPKGYQFFDANGMPLSLGNLYYYIAGTTTFQDTYSDSAGTIPNTNPIILDGSGRLDVDIYLGSASDYKEVLQTASATLSPWPDDNILRAIQVDWNATSGPSQILNKPALAAIAISGSYTDLSNTPPTNTPFTGDSGSGGTKGLVPAPSAGDAAANKFLSSAGGWATPPGSSSSSATNLTLSETATTLAIGSSTGTGVTIPAATASSAGALDSARASKIDGLAIVAISGSYADLANKPGAMTGATSTANGLAGFAPAPASGQQALFLQGDATWAMPAATNLTVSDTSNSISIASSTGTGATILAATASAAGALDAPRASKIDGLATVATSGSYADLLNKPTIPALPGALAGQNIDNVARLGIGTADPGNALSVNAPSVLFSNSGDIRATFSKGSASNVAAFNFQDNFSTRVQFGLLANDNFTVATSPDGSIFNNAIVASASGSVSFPNTAGFSGAASGAGGSSGLVPAPAAGQQGFFLRGDGSWAAVSGSATPGGAAGLLQYNNAGVFGGAAGLSYSATTPNLSITAQHASDVPFAAIGASGQTANLFEARNSSGTALAYADNGDTLHAANFQAIESGVAGWTLSARTQLYSQLPVPVFAPIANNSVMALDICPSGTPSGYFNNGLAWIDVCNVDVRTANGQITTARIGNFGSAVEFGSRGINGAATPIVNFSFNGTAVATLQSTTLMALPSGNKLLIGGTAPYTHAGALEVNGSTTYTNELGAINIHTGTDAQPELIAGVDNANGIAYLQAASRNANLTGTLKLNPNGGALAFGSAGSGVNSSGAFVGNGTLLTGTGLWTSASYSASIPLAGLSYMPQQSVSGAINFTSAANPAAGGFCSLRLVADGTHVPTFSGFKQSNWSKSYVNNAGALNVIEFWYDGIDAWYSISQQTAAQPGFVSAQIASASPNIVAITLAAALNTSVVPAASAFSVAASGGASSVSSVALSGSIVSLTLSRNIATGETVTVSYAAPGSNALIDSTNTYNTASFSGQAVTNNVSGGSSLGSVLRLTSLTNVAESTDSTFGYDYSATIPANYTSYGTGAYAASGTALPASADGYFGIEIGALSTNSGNAGCPPCIGFKTSAGAGIYSTMTIGIYGNSSTYAQLGGGTAGTSLAPTTGDIVRLRRAGTAVFAEVSRNSGTSWTTIFTWTGVTAAALYADFDMFSSQSANQVFSSPNWA